MLTRSRKRAASDASSPSASLTVAKPRAEKKAKQVQHVAPPPAPDARDDDSSSDDSLDEIDQEAILRERRVLIDPEDPVNGIVNFTDKDVYVVPAAVLASGRVHSDHKLNYYPRHKSLLGTWPVRCISDAKDTVFPCGTAVDYMSPVRVDSLPPGLPRILVEEKVADILRVLGYDGEVYTTGLYADSWWKETYDCQTLVWPFEGLDRVPVRPIDQAKK
jgi:hypothetical protein